MAFGSRAIAFILPAETAGRAADLGADSPCFGMEERAYDTMTTWL